MPKALSFSGSARPLLDIASYARRGPGKRDRLSPEEVQLIERTVRRTPEVMVKVLSRGGQDATAVGRHFAYLSRKGDIEIETDDGRHIEGKGAEVELLEDWDLDIQEQRPTSALGSKGECKPPKLVHKILFSMPPGTPPKKVLEAVKVFAREEFGAKHRYAMVLHTDEPHPHVHMVVKAVSEEGVRLNIRKATLRDWRREFARRLREQGVEANATERAVRGQIVTSRSDAIFRAAHRGVSTHMEWRLAEAARSVADGPAQTCRGRDTLERTRVAVQRGWLAVGEILVRQGEVQDVTEIRRFAQKLSAPRTDHEFLQQLVRARGATQRELRTRE
jgi:Relaxase/Mobilisation nuclease domain